MSSQVKSLSVLALLTLFGAAGHQAAAQQAEYCRTSRGNMSNGYHYEMWLNSPLPGTACLTVLGNDARFKVDWNLTGYGFVARVGLLFDQKQTIEQIGWVVSDFEHTMTAAGHAWVGVYGWTVEPLIEYYIIEDWVGWKPSYTKKGVITVDGGEYDVFTNTRVQQPSIKGNQTFEQWYSVRKTARKSGRISISEHFAKWKGMGMPLGRMYEAKLKVEGLNGNGTVEFTKATVVVDTARTSNNQLPYRADRGRGLVFDRLGGAGTVALRSPDGRLMRTLRVEAAGSARIPTEGLAPGVYIAQFKPEGKAPRSRALLVER